MTRTMSVRTILLLLAVVFASSAVIAQGGPEFSIALSPAVVTLPQGAVTSFNLTFESNENPTYSITLAGLPAGVQAETTPVQGGTGNVVLYASSDATVGSFAVQVTAHVGKNSQTQILTLNIRPLQPVPQWEYTEAVASSDTEFLAYANNLGDQGWELVSVRFQEGGILGFFKRIKR